jgi:hypothetical protein
MKLIKNFRYLAIVIFYTLASYIFLKNESSIIISLLGGLVVLFSIPYRKDDFQFSLSVLPFSLLLGSIFKVDFGVISLSISDLLLALNLIIYLIFNKVTFRINELTIFFILLLLFSTILSISPLSSLIVIIGLVQWGIYYFLCKKIYFKKDDCYLALDRWSVAVTISSMLVIASYFAGKPLILTEDKVFTESFNDLKQSADYFLRASFFVTSFIFVNGSILIYYFIQLIFNKKSSFLLKIKFIIFLIINFTCAILMQNKSVLFSVIFLFVVILIYSLYKNDYRRKVFFSLVACFFFIMIFYNFIIENLDEKQVMFFFDRIYDKQSYNSRIPIWINVIEYTIMNPKVIFFGIGPDLSIRESNAIFFDKLFSNQGSREQAVDSNYLTFILNYGIILSSFLFINIILIIKKALNKIKDDILFRLLFIFPIISWLIISITQLHGVSKPAFLIIFYLALSDNFKYFNRKDRI